MKIDFALKNFQDALNKLEEFLSEPIVNDRDKAGIIQAFEYSFETCWKYIQKAAESHSKLVGSPKQAFKAAFELGWIKESEQSDWLQMQGDRNLTSHTYRKDIAEEVLGRIIKQHFKLLKHFSSRDLN